MLQLLHHTTSLLYTPRKCDICPTVSRTSRQARHCMSHCVVKSATYVRHMPVHRQTSSSCMSRCVVKSVTVIHHTTSLLYTPRKCDICPTYARTSTDKLVTHVALCREKCYSYYTILLHCSTHPESATYVRHMPVHRQTSSSRMSRCVVKSVTVITPYYLTALHTPKVRHMSDICPYIDRQARHACRAVS